MHARCVRGAVSAAARTAQCGTGIKIAWMEQNGVALLYALGCDSCPAYEFASRITFPVIMTRCHAHACLQAAQEETCDSAAYGAWTAEGGFGAVLQPAPLLSIQHIATMGCVISELCQCRLTTCMSFTGAGGLARGHCRHRSQCSDRVATCSRRCRPCIRMRYTCHPVIQKHHRKIGFLMACDCPLDSTTSTGTHLGRGKGPLQQVLSPLCCSLHSP